MFVLNCVIWVALYVMPAVPVATLAVIPSAASMGVKMGALQTMALWKTGMGNVWFSGIMNVRGRAKTVVQAPVPLVGRQRYSVSLHWKKRPSGYTGV